MPRRKRLDTTPEWKALKAHAAQMKAVSLRELFAADPDRGRTFSLEAGGWYLDYSKNRVTAETMALLQALCPMADLRGEIDAMFSGKKINET
ncbi:MAG TPA: glucose-6-phosphate isomerase, partial [Kiritimatiellia bacterium]|nr:glucose-6-phosphate isomerase [Kiritimatiellia bacterium]HPR69704.1 glucose-6-phosphate isomerase [Kiritimatiellia bacterium]